MGRRVREGAMVCLTLADLVADLVADYHQSEAEGNEKVNEQEFRGDRVMWCTLLWSLAVFQVYV